MITLLSPVRHRSVQGGPNNIAVHLFSVPSLADYERYRTAVKQDEVALAAWRFAEETRCIISFERSFMQPVFE